MSFVIILSGTEVFLAKMFKFSSYSITPIQSHASRFYFNRRQLDKQTTALSAAERKKIFFFKQKLVLFIKLLGNITALR